MFRCARGGRVVSRRLLGGRFLPGRQDGLLRNHVRLGRRRFDVNRGGLGSRSRSLDRGSGRRDDLRDSGRVRRDRSRGDGRGGRSRLSHDDRQPLPVGVRRIGSRAGQVEDDSGYGIGRGLELGDTDARYEPAGDRKNAAAHGVSHSGQIDDEPRRVGEDEVPRRDGSVREETHGDAVRGSLGGHFLEKVSQLRAGQNGLRDRFRGDRRRRGRSGLGRRNGRFRGRVRTGGIPGRLEGDRQTASDRAQLVFEPRLVFHGEAGDLAFRALRAPPREPTAPGFRPRSGR